MLENFVTNVLFQETLHHACTVGHGLLLQLQVNAMNVCLTLIDHFVVVANDDTSALPLSDCARFP